MSSRSALALVLTVLLAGAVLVPYLSAQSPQGKKYAVLVGVKDYDHSKLHALPDVFTVMATLLHHCDTEWTGTRRDFPVRPDPTLTMGPRFKVELRARRPENGAVRAVEGA